MCPDFQSQNSAFIKELKIQINSHDLTFSKITYNKSKTTPSPQSEASSGFGKFRFQAEEVLHGFRIL